MALYLTWHLKFLLYWQFLFDCFENKVKLCHALSYKSQLDKSWDLIKNITFILYDGNISPILFLLFGQIDNNAIQKRIQQKR